MTYIPPKLFLSTKEQAGQDNRRPVTIAFRQIERWANGLAIPTGGGGLYASLTGPGETVTPGGLTQAGGFTVNNSGAGAGAYIQLDDFAGAGLFIQSTNKISLGSTGTPTSGRNIEISVGTSGMIVNSTGPITFNGGTSTTGEGHIDVGGSTGVLVQSDHGPVALQCTGPDFILLQCNGTGAQGLQVASLQGIWVQGSPVPTITPGASNGIIYVNAGKLYFMNGAGASTYIAG